MQKLEQGKKKKKKKTDTGLSKIFTLNKIVLYMCHSGFPAITKCL